MITVRELMAQFRVYDAVLWGSNAKEIHFNNVEFFPFKVVEIRPRTVYLLQEGREVPPPEKIRGCCLIAEADLTDWSRYQSAEMTVITVRPGVSANVLLQTVQALLIKSYQKIQQRAYMMDALLEERGLANLVDAIADTLGNPLLVSGLQFQYLAISKSKDDDAYSEKIEQERENRYCCTAFAEILQKYEQNKRRKKPDGSYEPQIYTSAIGQIDAMVVSITIHGMQVAYLAAWALNHPFSLQDAELLSQAERMISIELQKSSAFASQKDIESFYIMNDLLKDPTAHAPQILERLKKLKFKEADGFRLAVVHAEEISAGTAILDIASSQIHTMCSPSLFMIQQNAVIFLFPGSQMSRMEEPGCAALAHYCQENHLRIGISNKFMSLHQAPTYLRQAREALRNGGFLDAGKSLYFYCDYALEDMLNSCRDGENSLENYIHPDVATLHHHDQKNGSNLIETLACYLRYPTQPAKAAEILNIHKNTLYYRLNLIKEISNLDLSNGAQLFAFNCSIKVLAYLGFLTAPEGR